MFCEPAIHSIQSDSAIFVISYNTVLYIKKINRTFLYQNSKDIRIDCNNYRLFRKVLYNAGTKIYKLSKLEMINSFDMEMYSSYTCHQRVL